MVRILSVVAGLIFCCSGLAQAIPITGLTGLDQADEVAGEHGQQGRDNARSQQVGNPTVSTTGSPTTALSADSPQALPEPTSLLLLGSGLVGLWFLGSRKRESWNQG